MTELGFQQTEKLYERLKDVNFDIIYSSGSGRAFKTAEIIKGEREINIVVDNNLREMNIGEWEGRDQEELRLADAEQLDNFWHKPHLYKPQSGETFQDVRDRVSKEINKIVKDNEGKTILVVSHSVALKSIMSYFEGRPLEKLWDPPHIHQTSLSKVIFENGVPKIVLYGDASHLTEKNKSVPSKAV
jgi:probable phosphoglycerate mutase